MLQICHENSFTGAAGGYAVRHELYSNGTKRPEHHKRQHRAQRLPEPVNASIRTALLVAAGGAVAASLIMQMMDRKHEALFVGQWAPTLVSIALWYQIVKSQRYA